MNSTLRELVLLAENAQPDPEFAESTVYFVIYLGDNAVLGGYYLSHAARDRQAFGQAVGKLLNAGYEVQTYKAPPDL